MSNTQDQSSSHFDVDANDDEYFASTVEVIDLGRDPVTGLASEPAHVFDIVWNLDLNTHLSNIKAPYVIDSDEQEHAPGILDPSKYIYILGSSSNLIQIELKQTLTGSDITSLKYNEGNGERTGSGANEVECMADLAKQMSTDGSTVTLLAADGSQDVTSSIAPHMVTMVSSGVGNSLEVGGQTTVTTEPTTVTTEPTTVITGQTTVTIGGTFGNFSLTSIPNSSLSNFHINGNIVLAWGDGVGQGAFYRSTDGGLTFTDISGIFSGHKFYQNNVAYSPKYNLYVAMSYDHGNCFTSSDGGLTWTRRLISVPDPIASTSIYYSSITESFWLSGFMYTTTDGITFTRRTNSILGLIEHSGTFFTDTSTSLFAKGYVTHAGTGINQAKILKLNQTIGDWEIVMNIGGEFQTMNYNPVTNRLITTDNGYTEYSSDDGETFTRVANTGMAFRLFVWVPEISSFVGTLSAESSDIYYTADMITIDVDNGILPTGTSFGRIATSDGTLIVLNNHAISVSSTIVGGTPTLVGGTTTVIPGTTTTIPGTTTTVYGGQDAVITDFMTDLKSQAGVHKWYDVDANNPQSAPVQVKNGLAQLFDKDPQLNNLIGSAATSSTFIDVAKVQAKMQDPADTFYTKLFSEQQLREVLEAVADKGSRISGTGSNRTFNFTPGDSITAVVKVRDSDSNNENTDRWLVTLQQS